MKHMKDEVLYHGTSTKCSQVLIFGSLVGIKRGSFEMNKKKFPTKFSAPEQAEKPETVAVASIH